MVFLGDLPFSLHLTIDWAQNEGRKTQIKKKEKKKKKNTSCCTCAVNRHPTRSTTDVPCCDRRVAKMGCQFYILGFR